MDEFGIMVLVHTQSMSPCLSRLLGITHMQSILNSERQFTRFEFISESGIRKRCKHGGRNHRMQHDVMCLLVCLLV